MKFFIYLLAFVASATSQSNSDILRAVNANFTANFFQEVIKEKPNRSVVMSAVSSLSLLFQLAKSSREATRDRMLKAIEVTNDPEAGNNTNHKVEDLVPPESLGNSTAAVVVNSVYFKGNWLKAFNPWYTFRGFFRVSSNETIRLRFMNQRNTFKYGKSTELDAELLELPYAGTLQSFVIVLPNQPGGINTLTEKLKDPFILPRALENLRLRQVRAVIPRFKIETLTDLGQTLKKVIDAANPSPEQEDKLRINKSLQKAVIEVNEQGSEVAAANELTMVTGARSRRGLFPNLVHFIASHPFYFALRMDNMDVFNGIFIK